MTSCPFYIENIRMIMLAGLCLLGIGLQAVAQKAPAQQIQEDRVTLYFPGGVHCKQVLIDSFSFAGEGNQNITVTHRVAGGPPTGKRRPLLTFHGNISYAYDYRSKLDTPFSASNFQQHQEQVYADATVKDRYPFRVTVSSRQSNSPYFQNYTDVNVAFNQPSYQRNIKQGMTAEMAAKTIAMDSVDRFERWMRSEENQYAADRNWLSSPARSQEIVQEKEKMYQQILNLAAQQAKLTSSKDSGSTGAPTLPFSPAGLRGRSSAALSPDSLLAMLAKRKDSLAARAGQPTDTENKMKVREKEADSLYKVIQSYKHRADSLKAKEDSTIRAFATEVQNARSADQLEDLAKKAGTHGLSSADKTLFAVNRFSVGRSAVNYSDLTVKNINVTGVNAEFNPSYYVAFAAGSVDYLFRDFITQPGKVPKQNLVLGRLGWGDKEKRIFILTVYTGTKNNFGGPVDTGASLPTTVSNPIFGYSLEGKYKLAEHVDFSAEAAKSSPAPNPTTGTDGSVDHAFNFSDRNNEAYSLKLNTTIPLTQSVLELFYKEIGANFQSYSLFNTGSRQESWGVKWRQYLFRKQLSLTVQVKKSNFDDPLAAAGYNSSLVFKTIQVLYRRPKWPVLMLGYMPSSQLLKSSGGQVTESVYYALTASALYQYSLHQLRMSSALRFSRFYNHGTDSGFVLYNAINVGYTHMMDIGRLHFQTDLQYNKQPQLVYWDLRQRLDVTISKHLTVGAGVSDDLVAAGGSSYWGGLVQSTLTFGKVGGLRMQVSKDYLPDGAGGLVPNNWGRVQWFKVF